MVYGFHGLYASCSLIDNVQIMKGNQSNKAEEGDVGWGLRFL